MKFIKLLLLALLVVACDNNDLTIEENSEVPAVAEEISPVVAFANGTSLTMKSKKVNAAPPAPSAVETPAYFFIRLDGSIIDGSHNAEEYWPKAEGKNNTVHNDTLNLGSFWFVEDDFAGQTSGEYEFTNTDTVSKRVITAPSVAKMINGSNLDYNENEYSVQWYAIKNNKIKDGIFHIDGVVVKDPKLILEIPISRELFIEADDFAIRRDGVYLEDIVPVNNKVDKYGIVAEEELTITIDNLGKLDWDNYKEYTYEIWLWAKEAENWNEHLENYTLTHSDKYEVRRDVYKGVGGRDGDTSYLKVSIHVTKK